MIAGGVVASRVVAGGILYGKSAVCDAEKDWFDGPDRLASLQFNGSLLRQC